MSEDHIWKVAQSVGFDDYELRPMLEAFAAISQQAQEPVGDRYFSYSTDMGFEEFATQQEAIDCANIQIKHYREDAIRDDEWPDEVDSVCWGVILGRSKEIDTSNEDHESADYKLYTTPPAPQPAPVDEQMTPSFAQLKQILDSLDRCHHRDSKAEFLRTWIRDWAENKVSRAMLALRPAVEPMRDDTARLDYLQERGATVDLLTGIVGFTPMRFRIGGLHTAVNSDIRKAIDAARGITAKADGDPNAKS